MLITPKSLGDIINCSQLVLFISLYSRNEQGLVGRLPEPLEPWGTARSWAQLGNYLVRPWVCLSFLKEDPLQAIRKKCPGNPKNGAKEWRCGSGSSRPFQVVSCRLPSPQNPGSSDVGSLGGGCIWIWLRYSLWVNVGNLPPSVCAKYKCRAPRSRVSKNFKVGQHSIKISMESF